MNAVFKKMEESDLAFFNEVRNECREMLHDTTKFSLNDTVSWFRKNKPSYFTIFLKNERIGYFRTSIVNSNRFVGMDLHKSQRGKGLAKELYLEFFKTVKEKEIYLLVKSKNKIAHQLYKSLGFIEIIDSFLNIDKNSILMKKNMNKKVLLTGGCGFVGHHVIDHILRNTDWDIYCFDKMSYSSFGLKRLNEINALNNPRLKFFAFDLCSEIPEGMTEEIKDTNYILHIAAESHVDNSISDPKPFIENNINSTVSLLEFSRIHCKNLEKFIFFSTDEVFGNAKEGFSYKEGDRHNCGNPYSASKSACESICESYANTYNLPILITNTMNIIGERQHVEKFVPKVVKSILNKEKIYVHSYPDLIKTGTRFYIHARNVADAFIFILQNSKERLDCHDASVGRYNIVGVKEISNLDLVKTISKIMGEEADYELTDFHSDRPGHDLRYALNGDKLASLGWKPPVNLEKSLEKTINWTIKNKQWL